MGEKECGATEANDDVELNFVIMILGAAERSGCAEEGDPVQFEVGGIPSSGQYIYVPFNDADRFHVPAIHHLIAMQQTAWYWFETRGTPETLAGISVEAIVDGTVCGETTLRVLGWGPAGFSRLIVPMQCAGTGSMVSFRVAGTESLSNVRWEPGLYRIELLLPGDVDCDLATNSIDAAVVLQLDAGLGESPACEPSGDVNDDGSLDPQDAILILQFDAGLIDSLNG